MNFLEALSESGKANWPVIYKKFTGKKWVPLEKDKRGIQCEAKLESLEEIDKLMRQKPSYAIDKQGREG